MDCWTIEYSNISKTILELYKAWTVGLLAFWAIGNSNISKKNPRALEGLDCWTIEDFIFKYFSNDKYKTKKSSRSLGLGLLNYWTVKNSNISKELS